LSAFNTVNTVNAVNAVQKPDAARRRSGTRGKARERRVIELAPSEHLSGAQWIQPTDDDGFQVVWFFSTGNKVLWPCTGHTRGSRAVDLVRWIARLKFNRRASGSDLLNLPGCY
jgi:hypothetical protein